MTFLNEPHMPAAELALPAHLSQKPMTSPPTYADGYCQSLGSDLGLSITCEHSYVSK